MTSHDLSRRASGARAAPAVDRRGASSPASGASPRLRSGPGAGSGQQRRRGDSDAFAQRTVHLFTHGAWRPRLWAAMIHLGLSGIAGLAVIGCILWLWYPGALAPVHGVLGLLVVLIVVDIGLGPLCTFLVFDRRKKSLPMDLAIVATLQLAALAYGVQVIHQGRPQYVVLVKDRFELVSPGELNAAARQQAQSNPVVRVTGITPQWLAVRSPESPELREQIMLESLQRGRDLHHYPALYVPLQSEAVQAAQRGMTLDRLRVLNPDDRDRIEAALKDSGEPESNLRVLPLRGPARDAAVLLTLSEGRVAGVVAVQPW
jgi:hypothetical protein